MRYVNHTFLFILVTYRMFPFNSEFKRKRSTKNKYSNTTADCKIETGSYFAFAADP